MIRMLLTGILLVSQGLEVPLITALLINIPEKWSAEVPGGNATLDP